MGSWSQETRILVPGGSKIKTRKNGAVREHTTRLDLVLCVGEHYQGSASSQGQRSYYFERDGFVLKIAQSQIVEQCEQDDSIWAMIPFAPDLKLRIGDSYNWCLANLELPRAIHVLLGIRPWGDKYLTKDQESTHKTSAESCDCAITGPCAHMDLARNYQELERSIVHLHCLRWTLPEIATLYNRGGAVLVLEQAKRTKYAPDGLYYCAP